MREVAINAKGTKRLYWRAKHTSQVKYNVCFESSRNTAFPGVFIGHQAGHTIDRDLKPTVFPS